MLSRSAVSDSLQPHGLQPARLPYPWGFFSKKIEVGCHPLLLGIFPTQEASRDLLHCRHILCHLSHHLSHREAQEYWSGSYPFSRGSSWPRKWTMASCIAGGFLTSWATREAPYKPYIDLFTHTCPHTYTQTAILSLIFPDGKGRGQILQWFG